jgi:hypothetical protein
MACAGHAAALGNGTAVYAREGVGRFLVRGGREVRVDVDPSAEDRVWRLSLFGPVLGLLLIQRGLLVLHGAAVASSRGAVLLLGGNGSGKSSLAAELCRRGYRLLTDDVVAIESPAGAHPRALTGVPLIKLWREAADLAPTGAVSHALHPEFDKLGCRLPDDELAEPACVLRVCLLEGGEDLRQVEVSPSEAFRAVMASLYAKRFGDDFVATLDAGTLFKSVTNLLAHVTVEVLRRPRDRSLLTQSADLVEQGLRRQGE